MELPMDFKSNKCTIIGSCNGLVCLTDDDYGFSGRVIYVFNPLLQKFKCIIGSSYCCNRLNHEYTRVHVGFWYDDTKSDYKLIRIMHFRKGGLLSYDKEQSLVEVYSLNTRSWRKINYAKVSGIIECSYQHVFVDGTLNGLAGYSRKSEVMIEFILSFDCRSYVFREVELPSYQEHHLCPLVPNLEVYKGCLALFVALGCDEDRTAIWSLWLMKEFGVAET
ncbi:F-box protein CPR30 [Forsythia ovata]|uniref:F-box protein CPR30 n=1 Tax=Forsythia ovata TaxID=205694 RepID=A0ABD1PZ20_9LAMI